MQRLSATVSTMATEILVQGEFTQELLHDEMQAGFLTNVPVDLTAFAANYASQTIHELLPPEFLFILHDSTTSITHFGGDFFASKPLYYGFLGGSLLVDSDLVSISRRFEKLHLNLRKLTNYFNWQQDDAPVDNATFYVEIKKLLPAQTASFSGGKLTFNFRKKNQPFIISDAAVAFRKFFRESIKKRILNEPVAANLSGGLDSSSVVSVISQEAAHKLLTIYFDAQTKDSDESEFVNEVVEAFDLQHAVVIPPENLFEKLTEVTKIIGQPDPGILPAFIHSQIFDKASELGLKIIVSGHGGDSITAYGFDYLEELLAESKWQLLGESIRAYESLRPDDEPMLARQLFSATIKKALRKKKYLSAAKLGVLAWTKFDVSFLKNALSKTNKPQLLPHEYFASRLLTIKDKKEKTSQFDAEKVFGKLSETQKNYVDFNFIQLGINGNEVLSLLAHQADKVVSLPFFDEKLLLSQLNASLQERFGNGYTRGVIREAFRTVLPEKISNRTSKADFTDFAHTSFVNLNNEFRRNFGTTNAVWKYIDANVYKELVNIVLSDNFTPSQKVRHTWLAMRVINFAIWLQYQSFDE